MFAFIVIVNKEIKRETKSKFCFKCGLNILLIMMVFANSSSVKLPV